MNPIKIFYSYAHEDQAYAEELIKHLSFLERKKKIKGWYDRKISLGSNWQEEINQNLDYAQIILMLLSPDFINSDYCYETETIRAIEKHRNKEAILIPLIIRPCLWRETEFNEIQALPRNAQPISSYQNTDQAWLEVANGILDLVNQIQNNKIILTSTVNKSSNAILEQEPEKQLQQFLSEHEQWYFNPRRIKYMALSLNYESLSNLTDFQIKGLCEDLVRKGVVKSIQNTLGDDIYRIIKK